MGVVFYSKTDLTNRLRQTFLIFGILKSQFFAYGVILV